MTLTAELLLSFWLSPNTARIRMLPISTSSFLSFSSGASRVHIPWLKSRSKTTPSANVLLYAKLDPIDYIKDRLYWELLETIKSFSAPNTTYTVVCGSILTSNVEDYDSFFQSTAVQRRLAILNSVLKPEIPKRKKYAPLKKTMEKVESSYKSGETDNGDSTSTGEKAKESEKKHVSWKRQLTTKVDRS
jgi:hypothetical protein